MLSIDEAIRKFRIDPNYAEMIHDGYFDRDVVSCGERFLNSGEFGEIQKIVGNRLQGAVIVDIGAGTGIASYAFARSGAKQIYAVEPDPSDEVGRGAMERIRGNLPITPLDSYAEAIPLEANSVDIVYARQVLHHILNLPAAMCEFARILKPNGMFIACREHVVDNEQQLQEFLDTHPVHQLAGGENAYPLDAYLSAIEQAGLKLLRCIEPWESVINAYPEARSQAELQSYARNRLHARLGTFGKIAAALPGVQPLAWRWIKRPSAGRRFSFVAIKAG
jgi:ubiquinone/menaquinone biosynthesis C-methylase UbiE